MADTTWVALIRGINVGGRNLVPMAALRRVFEETGAGSVSTYIQSGNVIFTSREQDRAALALRLERAIAGTFEVQAAVVLRTAAELAAVARAAPFGPDTSRLYVAFLANAPDKAALASLEGLEVDPDRFEPAGSELFLHYPDGAGRARLTGARVERSLGPGTIRNWRTVTRLAELAAVAVERLDVS